MKRKFYRWGRFWQKTICCLLSTLVILLCGGVTTAPDVTIRTEDFTESNRELKNPDRGFYHLYPFTIDDTPSNYMETVGEYCTWDSNTTLALVEINLQNYRLGEISKKGLENINELLSAWSESDKKLIVRFLYDLDGENLVYEPENLDIILTHMNQIGPVLQQHSHAIFTLQGLFIGNWGEMHSTKFDSEKDLQKLAQTLDDATGNCMYLSVRTPAQWRSIIHLNEQLSTRLGLFNDGMLASATDLGTYDMEYQGKQRRTRSQELIFQDELCANTPNGGEVVTNNPFNDYENAVKDLSSMHVTYLNADYDKSVLEKWAKTMVDEQENCDNVDGLTYIGQHLGYRLQIKSVSITQESFLEDLNIVVDFQNTGFAPLYSSPELILTLQKGNKVVQTYLLEHNLQQLTGGNEKEKLESIQTDIPVENLQRGTYRLLLSLKDSTSGKQILLANEQNPESNGYLLGEVKIG